MTVRWGDDRFRLTPEQNRSSDMECAGCHEPLEVGDAVLAADSWVCRPCYDEWDAEVQRLTARWHQLRTGPQPGLLEAIERTLNGEVVHARRPTDSDSVA